MFPKFFACFFLVKSIIDVVDIVFRRHEIQKVSSATFSSVRTMLGAIFHLFVFSLQTPVYETDENKNIYNHPMQNVTGNETTAAPVNEENPTLLYPHVHIVNNPMPFSSNMTKPQANDSNVFCSSGKAPSTSSSFLKCSYNGNAAKTSEHRIVSNSIGNASLLPP